MKGRAAHTGLEGEAVLEPGGRGDDLGNVFGHQQLPGIGGHTGFLGGNLLGVAHLIHRAEPRDVAATCRSFRPISSTIRNILHGTGASQGTQSIVL